MSLYISSRHEALGVQAWLEDKTKAIIEEIATLAIENFRGKQCQN